MITLKLKNDLKIIKPKPKRTFKQGMDDDVKSFKVKRDKLLGGIQTTRANIVQEQKREVDLASSLGDDGIRGKKSLKKR